MPPESAPRPPRPRASLSPLAANLLRGSVVVFVILLAAVLADVLFGLTLPQPVRWLLPLALAAALCVALAIGVAAYGAPQRPRPAGDADEPSD